MLLSELRDIIWELIKIRTIMQASTVTLQILSSLDFSMNCCWSSAVIVQLLTRDVSFLVTLLLVFPVLNWLIFFGDPQIRKYSYICKFFFASSALAPKRAAH